MTLKDEKIRALDYLDHMRRRHVVSNTYSAGVLHHIKLTRDSRCWRRWPSSKPLFHITGSLPFSQNSTAVRTTYSLSYSNLTATAREFRLQQLPEARNQELPAWAPPNGTMRCREHKHYMMQMIRDHNENKVNPAHRLLWKQDQERRAGQRATNSNLFDTNLELVSPP